MDYAESYGQMHKNPKAFPGYSIKWAIDEIADLVEETNSITLLDYGCGKGFQYSKREVHKCWGGILPTLYDVGVPEFSKKPIGSFDGVICTDVMEHIEIEDVEEIISDISTYASRFVFYHIACRPSKRKRLPDGRDVHLTVKAPAFWEQIIYANTSEALLIGMKFDTREAQ